MAGLGLVSAGDEAEIRPRKLYDDRTDRSKTSASSSSTKPAEMSLQRLEDAVQ